METPLHELAGGKFPDFFVLLPGEHLRNIKTGKNIFIFEDMFDESHLPGWLVWVLRMVDPERRFLHLGVLILLDPNNYGNIIHTQTHLEWEGGKIFGGGIATEQVQICWWKKWSRWQA